MPPAAVATLRPGAPARRAPDSGGNARDERRSRPAGMDELWLGIHLPTLAFDVVAGIHVAAGEAIAGMPFVVCSDGGPRAVVVAGNGAAEAAGIRAGMPVAVARTLVPALQTLERDAAAEQRTLKRLAAWAGRFSPKVSLSPPQALLLEVGGSLKLFAGVETLLERVRTGLAERGHHSRLAVSPTPMSARLLACAGRELCITDAARLVSCLGDLPTACLEIEAKHIEALRRAGVCSLLDLFRLPRDGLARRTTPRLLAAMDRLLGRRADPQPIFSPAPGFASRLPLPLETTRTELLLLAAARQLEELGGRLQARASAIERLDWRLCHEGGGTTTVTLRLVAPSRDTGHLLELLRERLERVRLPAPVHESVLRSPALRPLGGVTLELLPGSRPRHEEHRAALLERLQARLGADAVSGLRLVPEHRPEKAWRACAPGEAGPAVHFGRRPLWLLQAPLPLRVRDGGLERNGPLAVDADGERITCGWWDDEAVDRDYFTARRDDGVRYWVYRDLGTTRRWYVHGIFA